MSQADIYQLYAYAIRYESKDNILLYPLVPGATSKTYRLSGDEHSRRIRTEFIDLSYDIARNVERLKMDLRLVLSGGTVAIN